MDYNRLYMGEVSIAIKIIKFIIIFLMVVIFLYPFILTVTVSFKTKDEVWSNFFGLPSKLNLNNYKEAWVRGNIGRSLINSFYIAIVSTFIQILLSSMVAYLIVRVKIPLKSFLFVFFSIGMMIPLHAIVLPIVKRAAHFGLYNSHIYLILVYSAGGMPWFVFLISAYMKSIPPSLEEAALIDGAGLIKIFFRIILPLSKPVLMTCSILAFLGGYNELLLAMALLRTREKLTIPVALSAFTGMHQVNFPELTAAVTISIIPTVIIYLIFQEKVEKGLAAGAVKG